MLWWSLIMNGHFFCYLLSKGWSANAFPSPCPVQPPGRLCSASRLFRPTQYTTGQRRERVDGAADAVPARLVRQVHAMLYGDGCWWLVFRKPTQSFFCWLQGRQSRVLLKRDLVFTLNESIFEHNTLIKHWYCLFYIAMLVKVKNQIKRTISQMREFHQLNAICRIYCCKGL